MLFFFFSDSEDSGIYSNLIRSESLHDRSWFYADGEDFNYTNRVILEILETELVYVNDLHQIITVSRIFHYFVVTSLQKEKLGMGGKRKQKTGLLT